MEPWRILVWTVLVSSVAHSNVLPQNKSYTKVSISPYNNDSFQPDGKGRIISQVQTKDYLPIHHKKPQDSKTQKSSARPKSLLGKNALVGVIGSKPTFISNAHIPSSNDYSNHHISHVNNVARVRPVVSSDSFTNGIPVQYSNSIHNPGTNALPLTPAKPTVNQIIAVGNYAPAAIPAASPIPSFAPALPETNIAPLYPTDTVVFPAAPAVNTISAVPRAPVVVTGAENIPTPLDIQTTSTTQYHSQDELGQYAFGYSGGSSSRHETSDSYGTIRGTYSYIDPYGEVQTQNYIADDDGFRVVGTNLPSNPLRKKRSLIRSKLLTVPVSTVRSRYPTAHVAPWFHVPAKTIKQTRYLNGPNLSHSEPITYTDAPVGTLTNIIHYDEPISITGYVPRVAALPHHGNDVSYQKTPNIVTGYPPRAKELAHYGDDVSYQKTPSNIVDYSKITLFRADKNDQML